MKLKILQKTKEIRSKKGVLHFIRFAIFSYKDAGVFIHYFNQSDKEQDEHDHPWDFSTLVLYGGYQELHDGQLKNRGLFSYKKFKAEHSHRVYKLFKKSCVTLAFIGRKRRDWGYQTNKGWVDNQTYRNIKKENMIWTKLEIYNQDSFIGSIYTTQQTIEGRK